MTMSEDLKEFFTEVMKANDELQDSCKECLIINSEKDSFASVKETGRKITTNIPKRYFILGPKTKERRVRQWKVTALMSAYRH